VISGACFCLSALSSNLRRAATARLRPARCRARAPLEAAPRAGRAGLTENMLHRFRLPLLGWLAAATPLHVWLANVFLNLTDSTATPYLSSSEINWSRIALIGAAAVAALNYIIMFTLVRGGARAEHSQK
jgi:hypothetical protein